MWCSTECWGCEDQKCEHYISKTELYFENQRLKNQLQQKENIKKEVREYLNHCSILGENLVDSYCIDIDVKKELLEILDKDITKKSDYNYEKVEKENKE